MWFCFDGDNFETYETSEEAKKAADKALDYFACEAPDGWDEAAYRICWGKVTQHSRVTVERPRMEEDFIDPCLDLYQEIELRDVGKTENAK